jgi:[CysO sulfur-carrier protein]-S-L-cysteine hydrolase
MEIDAELLQQMVDHAVQDAPAECCGVVAVERGGNGGTIRAITIHAASNAAPQEQRPRRFEIDGREVLRLIDEIDGEGLDLGAIYHSHTRTAPYPSQTDINYAKSWPGVEWVILGVVDPTRPEVRSYLIEDGNVSEVAIGGTGASEVAI